MDNTIYGPPAPTTAPESDNGSESTYGQLGMESASYYAAAYPSPTPAGQLYGPSAPTTEEAQAAGPYTGLGPKNYQRSDERIKEDVCELLTHHGWIDASNIEVNVSKGVVTLLGTVDSRQAKRLAEDVIEGIYGVQDIEDQVRIQRQDEQNQEEGESAQEEKG